MQIYCHSGNPLNTMTTLLECSEGKTTLSTWTTYTFKEVMKCIHSVTIQACSLDSDIWPLQMVLVTSESSRVKVLCVSGIRGFPHTVAWPAADSPCGDSPGYQGNLGILHPTSMCRWTCMSSCKVPISVFQNLFRKFWVVTDRQVKADGCIFANFSCKLV